MAATGSSESGKSPQTSGSLFPQPKVRGRKKRVSKKNKSAWRKHSDIKDIEEFLDDQRLQLRTGGLVADKADDSLFYVDKQNDNELEAPVAKKRKKELKPLKIDQIIAGETSVKPVTGHAPPMGSGKVRRKEIKAKELEQKTGYISKERRKKLKLNSVQAGLKKPQPVREYYDLWGNVETEEKNTEKEEDEYYAQVTGKTRVNVPVLTQIHARKPSILPKVEVIHPGGSYNPTFEEHQELLQQAVHTESKKLKAEKKLERQARLPPKREWATRKDKLKELTEGLLDEEEDEEEGEEQEGEEQEGEQSIPKATIRAEDKKSRQKRRKEKEQREQEQQKTAEKTKKVQEHEVNRLKTIKKEINALEKKKEERQKKRADIRAQNADKPKRLSRHKYEEPFPEFKLSEELVGTLREFKPEGSVLKDRFKSLQRRNILETRVKAKRQKKYKKKYVEKKQYKEISINA
ncbi:ribosome biogenesis protein NOP53-like isoform X1 [Branchiostoma floridae x Branchiostoma belcheri]